MVKPEIGKIAAQLGPVRNIERNRLGSAEHLVLCVTPGMRQVNTIKASLELAKSGVSLLKAKHVVESMLDQGKAEIFLPSVSSKKELLKKLAAKGITATTFGSKVQ